MDYLTENGSENGYQASAFSDAMTWLGDQGAYRAMTNRAGGDQHLPALFVEAPAEHKAAADTKADTKADVKNDVKNEYKEKESRRAEEYARKHEKGTATERALLTVSALPHDLSVAAKPGHLKLDSNDFAKVAEAIPGATLDPTFRSLLTSVKSASIDGRTVKLEGTVKVPVPLVDGKMSAEATLSNPSFDVVADPARPNCLRLENIKGVSIGMLGITGDIKHASLTLVTDDHGRKSLQIEIPRPEQQQSQADPNSLLGEFGHKLGQKLRSAVDSQLPEKTTIDVPLDAGSGAQVVARAFENVGKWANSPEKVNPADLAAGIAGVDLKTVLDGALDGIRSVSKNGDKISIQRDKATSYDLGGAVIEAGGNIQFKVTGDARGGMKLSDISGIDLKLPVQLPQFFKDLGIDPGDSFYTSLKSIDLSGPDANGQRKLTLDTNNVLKRVVINLGSDMKPALDSKGNWTMYTIVENPLAKDNKMMAFPLRFDRNNQLAMSPQELLRIGSSVAWQASGNGGREGAGFGVIAVATEAGATALDAKDNFVKGATIIKDGAVTAGGAIVDGACTFGGWLKSGWNWAVGD